MIAPPFSCIYDLSDLSDAGADIPIVPNEEQRARIADWAGVDAVETFDGKVVLKRRSANRFDYSATLNTDIVQPCVLTLEPVHSHLSLNITRALHLMRLAGGSSANQEVSSGTDDGREEIQDSRYDLAGPLLEEFALAIDPYPRCPGVEFQTPLKEEPPESPFAVLRPLKGQS